MQRSLGVVALSAALSLPACPAVAGLSSYDVSGKGIRSARMELGRSLDNQFAFYPSELSFEQGVVYKLSLSNPSKVEHYFSGALASLPRSSGA
jgi:hypothetical protein